jgi:outer membrane protein assembly factor BamA
VKSVAFSGNKAIAAKTLGDKVAKLVVVGEPVLQEKLGAAAELVYAHYWDVGYANVRVDPPKPVAGPNDVVFKINEGPQFKLGPIAIKGDLPATEHARYLTLFGAKKGDIFNRTKIADGRKRMNDAIVATGRPHASVLPLTKVDLPAKTIAITLEVALGPAP